MESEHMGGEAAGGSDLHFPLFTFALGYFVSFMGCENVHISKIKLCTL